MRGLFLLLFVSVQGSGALDYPNGVPTSLWDSGQQWDYPNAWPPLQHMVIEGSPALLFFNFRRYAQGFRTVRAMQQCWLRLIMTELNC